MTQWDITASWNDPEYPIQVRNWLLNLDVQDFDFFANEVKHAVREGHVIPAIKAIRERYDIGLREAKFVADMIRDGAKLAVSVKPDSSLVDIVEEIEKMLRRAIREAGDFKDHGNARAELIVIRTKLSALCDRLMGAGVGEVPMSDLRVDR